MGRARSTRKPSALWWRSLGRMLERANFLYPTLLTFHAARNICSVLGGLEESKALAAHVKPKAPPSPVEYIYRRKGLINRKRKGMT